MVREALDGLGAPYLLLNQRRFSIMSMMLEISSGRTMGRLQVDGDSYPLEEFTAIFTRLMEPLPSGAERSAGKFAPAPTLPEPARYSEQMGRGCTGARCKSGSADGFELLKAIPGATHSPLRF